MAPIETLEDILHKEMTRKEFLTTMGLALLSLFGMSTILHFLFGKHMHQVGQLPVSSYGSSAYGGNKLA